MTHEEESRVHSIAWAVFCTLDQSTKVAPPLTWDHGATSEQRQVFRDELKSEFDFLKYCSHYWKVKQLAIELYPHYRQVHKHSKQWMKDRCKASPFAIEVDMHPPAIQPPPNMNLLRKWSAESSTAGGHRSKKAKSVKPDLVIHDPM